MTHRVPLIVAIVLLVSPVLYVGSYSVLVLPGPDGPLTVPPHGWYVERAKYRAGATTAEIVFWPLEQIDKTLRPAAWADAPICNGR